mmetsp:Transcript_3709/g.4242  ORF Transcript_3709/g.4242 Transcript_3709/m.4242 type:complete len:306 (+) Transcript_3709:430-1347(+)
MLGWGRVIASDNDLDLGEDTGGLLGIGADEVQAAGTLTVQTHDLGEGLSDDHVEALAEEEAKAVGILVEGARGEALVRSVEEGVELSALANIGDLLPLGLSGVHTGGVVGAGVEEHGGARLGAVEIRDHALDVETLGLLVEVAVLADGDASGGKDLVVVAPGGVANIDGTGSELLQELADDAEGASSGESLDGGDSGITNERAVPAEEDTLGALSELGKTVDGEVLLVEGAVGDDSGLSLAHDGEDVGLAVVVAVSADTEVNLIGVLVVLEANGQTEDGIGGGHGHVSELSVQSSESLHFEKCFI